MFRTLEAPPFVVYGAFGPSRSTEALRNIKAHHWGEWPMRITIKRRVALGWLTTAAAVAAGLSGCGGGGGTSGGTTNGGGTPIGGSTPPESRFYASWTTAPLDATAALPGA